MQRFLIAAFALVAPATLAENARAGWGSGGCAPVGAFVRSAPVTPAYQWRAHNGCKYLYRNGVQVAGYDPVANEYRTFDAASGAWSGPQKAPWQPAMPPACQCGSPCGCTLCRCGDPCGAGALGVPNFGLDVAHLRVRSQPEKYTLNNEPATYQEAAHAIEGSSLPDDAGKLHLTVIGDESQRKTVLSDLANHPALVGLKGDLRIQAYAADDWAVSKIGFVTTGSPTIYLQQPDGKVLHRQDSYDDGPEALATAIRKANPYQPKDDKDQRKSSPLGGFDWNQLSPEVLGLGGLSVLLLLGALYRKAMS